jgi:hypothetical protein
MCFSISTTCRTLEAEVNRLHWLGDVIVIAILPSLANRQIR